VVHQGALGDFLVAAGALEAVFTSVPDVVADFWSKREHVSLLSGKEYLGDFHPLDGTLVPSLLNDNAWKTAALPDFLKRADQVLIVGQEGSRPLAERLSVRLSAKVRLLRSFPPPDYAGSHAFEFISAQLRTLGLPCGKGFLSLVPPESEMTAAKELVKQRGITEKPVLIHPGSGGRKKIWPLANWRDLLHWITRELSLPVLLSVGPADECLRELTEKLSGEGITVIRDVSQARLAALIARCRLYVGSDSGVSHLAAAVGVPSVVAFGPTDPEVWAPRGEWVRVVRGNWNERDVFAWDPSTPPRAPDVAMARVVSEILNARAGCSR